MAVKDIALIPGGIPAFGNGPGGQIQQYQVATVGNGGGLVANQIANNTLTSDQMANNAIGPNQISANLIQRASGALTVAQIANLATGITVANAVSGQAYHVHGFSVGLVVAANNVAVANGSNVVLRCNGVNISAVNIPATVITGNVTTPGFHIVGGTQTLINNTALVLQALGTAFDSGANCSAPFDVWYSLVTSNHT